MSTRRPLRNCPPVAVSSAIAVRASIAPPSAAPILFLAALALALVAVAAGAQAGRAADWQPAKGPLMTRWRRDVKPAQPLPDYPRPQMVRGQWINLNGLWNYAITPKQAGRPQNFDGEILVPFGLESAMSGVMRPIDETRRLWYRRALARPEAHPGEHVLLHFGAVDWDSTVWVNGKEVARHLGGYDPFTCDITAALTPAGEQELVVAVWDPTDSGSQPRGKQTMRPGGIMYTATTGIWQTVWLEVVPETFIAGLTITPDADHGEVKIDVAVDGPLAEGKIWAKAFVGEQEVAAGSAAASNPSLTLKILEPRLWSPDDPFLYRLKIGLTTSDAVESYFGLRKIAVARDPGGVPRVLLNGKFVFQSGLLDQGFWPDGLYTAPTDEALRYDIEIARRLGFNMIRKHVKVEPDRWYAWCDRLGILVWQDMPSGGRGIRPEDADQKKSPEAAAQFERELKAMIDARRNHPSIVMWVPFNEGWGQYDTVRIARWIQGYDPTRLVDCASGWADRPAGNVVDMHRYPGPAAPRPDGDRAAVLGEFGGLGLPIAAHTWRSDKNWGYQNLADRDQLTRNLVSRFARIPALIDSPGLCASVYTQISDVEIEVNGLMTYDRAIIKPDIEKMAEANRRLHQPAPELTPLAPTGERLAVEWRYTTDAPDAGWMKPEFDDAAWKRGPGGFAAAATPGGPARTEWQTDDIYLRREFELPTGPADELAVRMRHGQRAEVYLNGELAADVTGATDEYVSTPLDSAALATLHPGKNLLAIHCQQSRVKGRQFIDAGLDRVRRASADGPNAKAGPWRSLFDGKTLKGWQSTPFAGHGDVEAAEEQLVLRLGEPLTGVSYTGDPPRDEYEIELSAMRVDGSDFFCGLTFPVGPDPCTLIVGGWGGGLVGLSSLDGIDASENETTSVMAFDNNRWYKIRLRVSKAKIEAWIDNDKVVDVDRAGKKISIRPEMELCKPLGFASYMSTAALKEIRVRRLDATAK